MTRTTSFMVLLLFGTVGNTAPGQLAQPHASKNQVKPTPIFNDELCQFKFDVQGMLVCAEALEEFTGFYKDGDPEIIGAYPDSDSDTIVVIAPHDAENAIRLAIARWIVYRKRTEPPTLRRQLRTLEFRRQNLLREMARVDVEHLEVADDQAKKLISVLDKLRDELNVVELQIETVNGYISRSQNRTTQSRVANNDRLHQTSYATEQTDEPER